MDGDEIDAQPFGVRLGHEAAKPAVGSQGAASGSSPTRGTEYCGNPERHEYELYLAVEDINHSRTKAKSPQTNGIDDRFHKTMLDESSRIASARRSSTASMPARSTWTPAGRLHPGTSTPGPILFWENSDADFLDAAQLARQKQIGDPDPAMQAAWSHGQLRRLSDQVATSTSDSFLNPTCPALPIGLLRARIASTGS